MSLVILGTSTCALCDRILAEGESLVSTSAFIRDRGHPLWPYSDAAMHSDCFSDWSERADFVSEFNRFWAQNYRGMRFMHPDGSIEEREPQPPRRLPNKPLQ